jgi:hypothetical protein
MIAAVQRVGLCIWDTMVNPQTADREALKTAALDCLKATKDVPRTALIEAVRDACLDAIVWVDDSDDPEKLRKLRHSSRRFEELRLVSRSTA